MLYWYCSKSGSDIASIGSVGGRADASSVSECGSDNVSSSSSSSSSRSASDTTNSGSWSDMTSNVN